jgi:predicted transposase/invertase (TIGR01784 family)
MMPPRAPRRTTLLDPKLDVVFARLFGAEQNRGLLVDLLNAVLRPPHRIVSVEILPTQAEPLEVDGKPIALDLRVRLDGGEQIDVEMQTRRHPALRERGLFYWGRLYTSQLQRGTAYPALRRCVVVFITDFVELAGARFHSVFQARERDGDELLTDHLELHFVELPKLLAQPAKARADEPSLMGWCRFLSATQDEELELLATQDPMLKQAKHALEQLSADPVARLQAEHREMSLLMWEASAAKGREEGREEGRAEGREEGRAEGREEGRAEGREEGRAEGQSQAKLAWLQKLLALKFGALPPEVVHRLSQAPEASLDEWSERLIVASTLDDVFAQ